MKDRSTRLQEIHDKGFKLVEDPITKSQYDAMIERGEEPLTIAKYTRLKTGLKTLDDAVLNLGSYRKVNSNYGNKQYILQAIDRHDYDSLRDISKYFYEASGIYQRLCKYMAFLYRYDWYVTPFSIKDLSKSIQEPKILTDFAKVLEYFDNSDIKRLLGNVALEVIKCGNYYGIFLDLGDKFTLQQLPSNYCRSRFMNGVDPVIELNMRFFDVYFTNIQYRMQVLSLFPKDIQKAYLLYKQGKLPTDYPGDQNGWYMIDPKIGVKFSLNDSDCPPLAGAIPSIIDLDAAQELDRKKMMQQLLKIIVQKLPLDKNGELIFDIDEAADIHNNAVNMLHSRATGIDVLTTFADVDVADMQDKNSTTTKDDLQKVERTVYNNLGVSQNLFNTDGNMSLEKSIANDEAVMRDLVLQFQKLLNKAVGKFNRANHYMFKVNILETTIYNYKELSKMYKEHTQIGYSKMLPQIALGHSQSSIIATASFENEALHLADIMIPPIMSSTRSSNDLQRNATGNGTNSTSNNSSKSAATEEKSAGRPEKPDDQKSDKTIQNRESMG